MTKQPSKGGAGGASKRRKLEEAGSAAAAALAAELLQRSAAPPAAKAQEVVKDKAKALIDTLSSTAQGFTGTPAQRLALRRAAHALAELCKVDANLEVVIQEGAVEAVVPLLFLHKKVQQQQGEGDNNAQPNEDVEKEASLVLSLLAAKPEYQARIVACNALPGLIRLLRPPEARTGTAGQAGNGSGRAAGQQAAGGGGVVRRAADAITNLAHENMDIKNLVREKGGIQPLVTLLDTAGQDAKVQRAAAGALRTLAFKNEQNKKQIVESGALPVLIQLLRSEDEGVHYEAVGVIGNLVHSSAQIKRQVLEEGALQPVISLLRSPCQDSQREAALLLGQFATTDADTKVKIVQRGAVPRLVSMLSQGDSNLKEMAAFALGRLAQNSDNQSGIVECGGLAPLLGLLESKHYNLQHNAAFALYGLADNEDNIPDMIRVGAVQRLTELSEKLSVQASKDCVHKTVGRLEQKIVVPRVLSHVIFMLRSKDRQVQRYAALSLAKLAPEAQIRSIFLERRGLDVLLDMLMDQSLHHMLQREAAQAVLELANKINATAPIDCLPAQPAKTVFLGEQFVNNPTLADVTFLVEDQTFHAHRIALLASSDAFRAMFNGGYKEKEAERVEIPNISFRVFKDMMTFCYTGNVEVQPELASELLQASDQYLLEGLKRLCEVCIASGLSVESLASTFELSSTFSAPQLAKRCVLFALEHYNELIPAPPAPPPSAASPTKSGSQRSDANKEEDDEDTDAEAPAAGAQDPAPTAAVVDPVAAAAAAAQVEQNRKLLARMVPHLRKSLVEDLGRVGGGGATRPGSREPGQP